jgi:hypothetical protein
MKHAWVRRYTYAYNILVGKPEGKRLLRRWEETTELNLT